MPFPYREARAKPTTYREEIVNDNDIKKYDRKQPRLKGYNYSEAGAYFITLCTKDKELYFENEKIREIVEECWLNIPEHFDSIGLDSYVIMPNHLHGILFLETAVVKRHAFSLQKGRRYQRIPVIIGGFKSAASKSLHRLGFKDFKWQTSYYDHIIRNEKELMKIREYIINNPYKWNEDAENTLESEA
jgi:REP element-mobilizing transposase RayT